MKYALFLGCLSPTRAYGYEVALRKVCDALGIGLVDMPGFNCCGLPIEAVAHKTWLALAAKNLCIAEEIGLDIITPCNGCVASLKKANKLLKEDEELRDEINEVLVDLGKEYKGKVEVKHFVMALIDDYGIGKLKGKIERPLKGVKVAAYYGCHILRPSEIHQISATEKPTFLDDIIEVIGARSVGYLGKMECCGAMVLSNPGTDRLTITLVSNKLEQIQKVNADCIATICPACYLRFDIGQFQVRQALKKTYNIPVFHLPELLGLAMGLPEEDFAFKSHKVKADEFLRKI
jgi:heterodisulfide reductase subunit B